ncbi:MAG: redoxin domain-containing protein [Flavobacteriales bacterium]|nr:redoxin domain-containing protein [Flavobacteriales bacterium]
MRRSGSIPLQVLFLSLAIGCGVPDKPLQGLLESSFEPVRGGTGMVNDLLGARATVLVTLDPECPFCQMYLPLLDSLVALPAYGAVRIVGVFASPYIPRDSAAKFMRASPAAFDGIMDPEFVLCKALGARVTPEVFVLDAEGELVYQGAIDDRALRAGKKRIQATRHYLSDALDAVLRGDRPAEREVAAVGCILEYDP